MQEQEPLPRDLIDHPDASTKLSTAHLMALAVHERGEPMTYEEIRMRLELLGVRYTTQSLQKRWRGLPPLRKTADGKLAIVQGQGRWSAWQRFQMQVRSELGLREPRVAPVTLAEPAPRPAADAPMTLEELSEAWSRGVPGGTSRKHVLALILDAAGGTAQPGELAQAHFEIVGLHVDVETIARSATAGARLFILNAVGDYVLDSAHPGLLAARARARELCQKFAHAREQADRSAGRSAEREAREAEELRAKQQRYRSARKLLVRPFLQRQRLVCASILDPDTREFLEVEDPAALCRELEAADILIALDPYPTFDLLGFDPGVRTVVDLSPSQKGLALNRSGRRLKITPELVLRSTLRTSQSLGNPKKLAAYAASGQIGKLHRRLRADLKSLFALYMFGCTHGCVLLDWGFIHERLSAAWDVGGLPHVHQVLNTALASGQQMEAVLGSAPGWSDPWSRARVVQIAARSDGHWHHVFEVGGDGRAWSEDEIFAIRPANLARGRARC